MKHFDKIYGCIGVLILVTAFTAELYHDAYFVWGKKTAAQILIQKLSKHRAVNPNPEDVSSDVQEVIKLNTDLSAAKSILEEAGFQFGDVTSTNKNQPDDYEVIILANRNADLLGFNYGGKYRIILYANQNQILKIKAIYFKTAAL